MGLEFVSLEHFAVAARPRVEPLQIIEIRPPFCARYDRVAVLGRNIRLLPASTSATAFVSIGYSSGAAWLKSLELEPAGLPGKLRHVADDELRQSPLCMKGQGGATGPILVNRGYEWEIIIDRPVSH